MGRCFFTTWEIIHSPKSDSAHCSSPANSDGPMHTCYNENGLILTTVLDFSRFYKKKLPSQQPIVWPQSACQTSISNSTDIPFPFTQQHNKCWLHDTVSAIVQHKVHATRPKGERGQSASYRHAVWCRNLRDMTHNHTNIKICRYYTGWRNSHFVT